MLTLEVLAVRASEGGRDGHDEPHPVHGLDQSAAKPLGQSDSGLSIDERNVGRGEVPGWKIHRNRHPDFPEINKVNADGAFTRGSWFSQLNQHLRLWQVTPSSESSRHPDQVEVFRHLNGAYFLWGTVVHTRKHLRVARHRGEWASTAKFWEWMVPQFSQLWGRLFRLRRRLRGY